MVTSPATISVPEIFIVIGADGRPIGAGGMGEVYRATDTRLKRDVAVKVLSARLTAEPSAKQRFEREAHAASALRV